MATPDRPAASVRYEDALRLIAESDHATNMLGTGCVGAVHTAHKNDGAGNFAPAEVVSCAACFAQEVLDGKR